jgi:hypothetical protein
MMPGVDRFEVFDSDDFKGLFFIKLSPEPL